MITVYIDNFIELLENESNTFTQETDIANVGDSVTLIDENHTDWSALAKVIDKGVKSLEIENNQLNYYIYKVEISMFIF